MALTRVGPAQALTVGPLQGLMVNLQHFPVKDTT
jgi:hypothetical protein